MKTFLRRSKFFAVAAALLAGLSLVPHQAEAGWRHHRGYNGGAVAAGIIGGVAVGALLAGAARPAYAQPAYYGGGYGYGGGYAPVYNRPVYHRPIYHRPVYHRPVRYAPVAYYDQGPVCYVKRRKVWLDPYSYTVRRVRVCH
jgi:hypothetical protein